MTAPVAPETLIFVPATIEVTPVLDMVTAPVAPETPIPDPATAEVTPVLVMVTVSGFDETDEIPLLYPDSTKLKIIQFLRQL